MLTGDKIHALNAFFYHFNGTARAFLLTNTATLAIFIIDLKFLAGTQFDNGIVRANAITIVTLKTVAAGHAATGLKQCRIFG